MDSFDSIVRDIHSVLKINQSMDIVFDHPDFLEEYRSRAKSLGTETISIPIPTNKRVPVTTHCWVYFIYKDQRYGFETTVKGYEEDNILQMILNRPREILRFQRRKHFRVPVDLPVTYQLPRRSAEGKEEICSGTIRNMSSGGILIITDEDVPLGSELHLFFTLADEVGRQEIPAKIVRGGMIERRVKKNFYEYGIEFNDMPGRLRGTLMHFVFSLQIELNRQKRKFERRSL
jgi:c-di-GMP-binding flagellar brake protein YcgR